MFIYKGYKNFGYGNMAEFEDITPATYPIHENENVWMSEKDINIRINALKKRGLSTHEEEMALVEISIKH